MKEDSISLAIKKHKNSAPYITTDMCRDERRIVSFDPQSEVERVKELSKTLNSDSNELMQIQKIITSKNLGIK